MKNTFVGTWPMQIKASPSQCRFATAFLRRRLMVSAFLYAGLLASASAQTFTTLYNFSEPVFNGSFGSTNVDGVNPFAGLILSGNTLYGTAAQGGEAGEGTVFAVNTDGSGFNILHHFTSVSGSSSTNTDGAASYAGLVLSANTLYGTTYQGGVAGQGSVFAVKTDGTGFTNLHSFTATSGTQYTNTDGASPTARLILSGNTLYGSTTGGGRSGNGSIFKIQTDGTGFTNLHNFTALGEFQSTNSDGTSPRGELILSGNTLFGTALYGGSFNAGTVFALNANGTGFKNLHNFTFSDGGNPRCGLLLSGNILFGTTEQGGNSGNGTVFALNTNGTGYSVIYNFTATSGYLSTNDDGANPDSTLTLSGGTLYGTAYLGGTLGNGVIFALSTNGTGFTNLHSFAGYPSDGANPRTGLVLSSNTLYGTGFNGGTSIAGTVYSLLLPPPPNQTPVVANPVPDTNSTYGAVFSFTLPANTFSDPDFGQTLAYTASNLPPGLIFDGPSRTFSGTNTSVGTYPVTVTATDNGSPPLSTNDTFNIIVGKAPLTAKALDQGITYGDSFFPDPYFGVQYTGFAFFDSQFDLDVLPDVTTTTNGSPAGAYPITVSGGSDNHYQITSYQDGTLTINPASLQVQADDNWRPLGQTNPPLTAAISGLRNNDNITPVLSTTATPNSPLGKYPITVTLQDPSNKLANYTVTLGTGTLAVVNFQVDYEVIRSFGFTNSMIGNNPSALIEASDGAFYGTASSGGDHSAGTVFKLTMAGTGTVLHHFSNGPTDGSAPVGALIEGSDGLLYGVTSGGGSSNSGTVFSLNKDGSGFTILRNFASAPGDGTQPGAGLIEGSDHALYGTTIGGGMNGQGTVFRMSKDGGGYSVLYSFGSAVGDGYSPAVKLMEGSGGALYGTTQFGGADGFSGTIFRLNKDGSGYTVLHSFSSFDSGGSGPQSGLVEGGDQALYGTTRFGGTSGAGTVFKIGQDGSNFTTLYEFNYTDGLFPTGELLNGSDGMLYGTTYQGGGVPGFGNVFKISTSGTGFASVYSFASDSGYPIGALVEVSDGTLYGVGGATGGANGIAFKLSKDGTGFDIVWRFNASGGDGIGPAATLIEGSDGRLYGTTYAGGSFGFGTVFDLNKDGTGAGVLRSFDDSAASPENPDAELLEANNGVLYSTTYSSGLPNFGTLYQLDKDGSNYAVTYNFSSDAYGPSAAVIQGDDGALYGTTQSGGTAFLGTVFKVNPNGTGYSTLYNFGTTAGDGGLPFGRLIEASDGELYGTTYLGTVFKLSKDGSGFTNLCILQGTSYAGLLEGSDGLLYGTTSTGGDFGSGTVFRVNKDGSGYTILRSLGQSAHDAATPTTRLIEGPNGALYGTADRGGLFGFGGIFTIEREGTNYLVLHSFDTPAEGGYLGLGQPALVLGSDGSFYGTTAAGGAFGLGAVYRFGIGAVTLPPPTLYISGTHSNLVTISWSPPTPNFVLQQNDSLDPLGWTNASSGSTNPISLSADSAMRFYRLRLP